MAADFEAAPDAAGPGQQADSDPGMGDAGEVTCLLVPAGSVSLLLPGVTVAEILPWRELGRAGEQPSWCVGYLDWRGYRLPVLWFPALNGGERNRGDDGAHGAAGQTPSILVMNRVRHAEGLPFYGMLADGPPRLLHLGHGDAQSSEAALGPAEAAAVTVATDEAVIPSFAALEAAARELG